MEISPLGEILMQRRLSPALAMIRRSAVAHALISELSAIFRNAALGATLIGLLVIAPAAWGQGTVKCPEDTGNPLKPYGDPVQNFKTDLVVDGQCDVDDPTESGTLKYYFQNVNIIN